jgi:hypothetical protein
MNAGPKSCEKFAPGYEVSMVLDEYLKQIERLGGQ